MSITFLPDLTASRDLMCAIEITTTFREFGLTGVKSVDEEGETVTIFTPRTFGDTETTTTFLLGDIVSVSLHTDVAYSMGRDKTEGE